MVYVFAFLASLFFAIIYNIQGKLLFFAALCGVVGKFVFDIVPETSLVFQFLSATIAMSLYSEIIARLYKVPVMVILTVGIIPIIPGSGVYYTINELLKGDFESSWIYGLKTLLSTGATVLGIVVVSTFVRMVKIIKRPMLQLWEKGK